jgi:CBS domain-containing protein
MPTSTIVSLLILGALLVVGSLILRAHSAGRYELKTIDVAFLVIPLLLAALATGKLKGFDLFGVKADLSALWSEAAQSKIDKQVVPAAPASVQDAVRVMEMAMKGGVDEIQRLIERKVEALEFRLGQGGYYGPAIKKYFEALSGSSHLRSVVVDEPNGTLFAIYSAADLIGYLRVAGDQGYASLQQMLNSGSDDARRALARLPGFVGAQHAVVATTSKRDALARMEQLNVDGLPVVDGNRRFVGTVERSKLTASLILAVTDKLESR